MYSFKAMVLNRMFVDILEEELWSVLYGNTYILLFDT